MIEQLCEVPEEFWKVFRSARFHQLLDHDWKSKPALTFANHEIECRKRIDLKYGPSDAVFSVPKIAEFPFADRDDFFLKLPTGGPFGEVVDFSPSFFRPS